MAGWSAAGVAGSIVGLALFVGAAVGWLVPVGHRVVATAMNFGAGVLIAVVSFELLESAYRHAGAAVAIAGLLGGALIFCAINAWLSRSGAKHRKRCGECGAQPSEAEIPGSGLAIAVGTLLDAAPESLVIGLDAIGDGTTVVIVAGFVLGNLPQGVSGAAGMKYAGRSRGYVMGVWGGLAVLSGIMPVASLLLFRDCSLVAIAAASAVAAGAALAMVTETMIPEASHHTPTFGGLVVGAGFAGAFLLSHAMNP